MYLIIIQHKMSHEPNTSIGFFPEFSRVEQLQNLEEILMNKHFSVTFHIHCETLICLR